MAEVFDYVVARHWDFAKDGNSPFVVKSHLAIYMYGSEIQTGTIEDAGAFLAYVKLQSPAEGWAIYKIKFEKLEDAKSKA